MTQKLNNTYVGTELKMHIGFDYQGDKSITLETINFSVDFYCQEGRILHFEKSELIYDNGEYYAGVETKITGPGMLKMKLTAYIPEYGKYGKDYLRTEVAVCNTNVRILECGYI